tara:strand:+ start:1942 stop:2742 length:801 start_codon:yes stop_codon:yes gene_type:complete
MQEYFIVILNGIIEGLTEFIPVSSTGHLIILDHFLPFPSEQAHTFQIAIQFGAILAVLVYYRGFLAKLLSSFASNYSLLLKFICCITPVFLGGYLAYDLITGVLFSANVVVAALIFGGIAMIITDIVCIKKTSSESSKSTFEALSEMSYKQALCVGLFQLFSLWPGMSRSGSTIVGGVVSGLSYKTAADFSFLCAAPVIGAATAYDLLKTFSSLTSSDLTYIGIGLIVSFFVGLVAITTFIKWISKWHLLPFGIYRILLGIGVLCL